MQHSEECMCRLRNIAMHYYQQSVTTRQTDGQTDAELSLQYASQATQKLNLE